MPRIILLLLLLLTLNAEHVFSQGKNHQFLLGYDIGLIDSHVTSTKARLLFDSTSATLVPDSFKIPFRAAQANISDEAGNLLMCTNGCWISDATGDTMQNGGGLAPGLFSSSWCDNTTGIPTAHACLFIPWPGDSNKYALIYQVSSDVNDFYSTELYYAIIDKSLNGGLGSVTQKNLIATTGFFNLGINACKNANGRDWWIVMLNYNTHAVTKILFSVNGPSLITTQTLNFPSHGGFNGQPQFSQDGTKYAYYYSHGSPPNLVNEVRYMNFDRCSGNFNNETFISTNDSVDGGLGLSFSANSKYLYFSTFDRIFQLNTDTTNILASIDTVAIFDGYGYPFSYLRTDFWLMYLAANGKIYISSGSSTIDLNVINQPDSDGIACDVQQHSIRLPCYSGRGNVLHPNYYLGPVIGSACDTLAHVGLQEHMEEVQNFQIAPNPISAGALKITYLLPQNAAGVFEVFDLNGKLLYSENLAPWSSLQYVNLPALRNGVYICEVRSGASRMTRKLVVIK